MKTDTNLLNFLLCCGTYPTGPAARTSLSRSRPLIRTYTPFPSPPITFAAKCTCNKMKKKRNYFLLLSSFLNWEPAILFLNTKNHNLWQIATWKSAIHSHFNLFGKLYNVNLRKVIVSFVHLNIFKIAAINRQFAWWCHLTTTTCARIINFSYANLGNCY